MSGDDKFGVVNSSARDTAHGPVSNDRFTPHRALSQNQFADWIGPTGSFGEPDAVGGTFTGTDLGAYPGATPWTAST